MLHVESYWKAHRAAVDEHETTCALGEQTADALRVMVPEDVDIPLPRDTVDQIAVPASINGRDLSQGTP